MPQPEDTALLISEASQLKALADFCRKFTEDIDIPADRNRHSYLHAVQGVMTAVGNLEYLKPLQKKLVA